MSISLQRQGHLALKVNTRWSSMVEGISTVIYLTLSLMYSVCFLAASVCTLTAYMFCRFKTHSRTEKAVTSICTGHFFLRASSVGVQYSAFNML